MVFFLTKAEKEKLKEASKIIGSVDKETAKKEYKNVKKLMKKRNNLK